MIGTNSGKGWKSLNTQKRSMLNQMVGDFNKQSTDTGFDFDVWVSGYEAVDDAAYDYFSTCEKGAATQAGLKGTFDATVSGANAAGTAFGSLKKKASDALTGIKGSLKNVGRGLLGGLANFGVGMLISTGLSLAADAIDNLIHADEKAIDAGNDALESISESISEYNSQVSNLESLGQKFTDDENTINSTSDAIDLLTQKYAELRQGVSADNTNYSLSDEEYQSYLDISNQLAEIYPSLVAGTDAQGNSLLNLSSNASDAAEQVQKLLDTQMAMTNMDIAEKSADAFKGINTQFEQSQKVLKDLQTKQKSLSEVETSYDVSSFRDRYEENGVITLADIKPEQLKEFKQSLANALDVDADTIGGHDSGINLEGNITWTWIPEWDNSNLKITDEVLDKAAEQAGLLMEDSAERVNAELGQVNSQITAEQLKQDSLWQNFIDSVAIPYMETSPQLKEIPSNILDAIGTSMSEVDWSGLFSEYNGDFEDAFFNEFIVPLSSLSEESQSALSSLLEIDPKSMDLGEYQRELAKALNSITSDLDEQEEWKVRLGLDVNTEEIEKQTKLLKETFSSNISDINQMTGEERQIAYDLIVNDKFSGTFEELQKQIGMAKTDMIDLNSTPLWDEVEKAQETEDYVQKHATIREQLDAAKEMRALGQIGRDDFTSIAAWMSPTGSTSAENFDENIGKFDKYFTEDVVTGLNSYFAKLEEKGYAKSKKVTNEDGTVGREWEFNIDDFEKLQHDIGMSWEAQMALFNTAKDYGFHNNFVSSQEEGIQRIADLSQGLVDEMLNYEYLTSAGDYETDQGKTLGNQTAIDESQAEIDQYKQDIKETQEAMKTLSEVTAQRYEVESQGAQAAIEGLAEQRKLIAEDTELDDTTKESLLGMLDEEIQSYADKYHIELDADMNIQTDESQLAEVQEKIQALSQVDYSDVSALVGEADQALASLQEAGMTTFDFDFSADADSISGEIEKATALLHQFQNEDGTVDLSLEGASEAMSILSALIARKQEVSQPAIMSVDTSQLSGAQAEVVGLLQQYQQARSDLQAALQIEETTGIDINTSAAEQKVAGLAQQIRNLGQSGETQDVLVSLGFDVDSEAGLLQAQINQVLDGLSTESLSQTLDIAAKTTGKSEVDALKTSIDGVKPKDVAVTASVAGTTAVNNLASAIAAVRSKSVTITTNHVSKNINEANGTFHSAIRSFANGTNIAIPKDQNALINELGPEAIARDGRLYVVPGGAQFFSLKKGDIVFNHRQTQELLKHQMVTSGGGRGTLVHANGTIHSYAGGTSSGFLPTSVPSSKKESNNTSSAAKSAEKAAQGTQKAAQSAADAAEDTAEALDWIEKYVDMMSRTLDAMRKNIENLELYRNQNTSIDRFISQAKSNMLNLQASANYYMSKANSLGLDGSYVSKITQGRIQIEDIADENLREKISQYQEWYNQAVSLGDEIAEINQEINEMKIQKLENIKDDYDNLQSYHESMVGINDAYSELAELNTGVGNLTYLNRNLDQNKQIKAYYQAQVKEMQQMLDSLTAQGVIGLHSDTWLEWQSEINAAKEAIAQCDEELINLKQSIREVRWKSLNDTMENLEHVADLLSSVRGLMSEEGAFGYNDFHLTDSGYAQLGIMGQELVNAKQQVANYNVAIDALKKDLKNGNITQAEYNDSLKEYEKAQMDAVQATQDARDAILDMIRTGIEKETEAMEELIQKRKDDLSAQKEYYDFQKQMLDQTKDMNNVRAQLAAIEGDDSSEAEAKRKRLQSQLQEMQEQYDSDQRDHEYDVVQDAYDQTLEDFKENQEETLYTLETSLEAQNQAISNMLSEVKTNYSQVYEELQSIATQYGITLNSSLTNPWKNATAAAQQYADAVNKVSGNVSVDTSKIQSNYKPVTSSNQVGKEASASNISNNGTWIKQNDRWWYQNNDGSYTKNNWQAIDGKWYKFDEAGWMQTGWQPWGQDSKGRTIWYYLKPSGAMAASEWIVGKGGKQYYVDHTGAMVREAYIKSKNKNLYYWVNADGVWEPQWDTATPNLKKYKLAYRSGTRSASSGWHLTDENGQEVVVTNDGIWRQFQGGEKVFNDKSVDFLYNFAANPQQVFRSLMPAVQTNLPQGSGYAGDVNVNYHIDSVTKETLPDVEAIIKQTQNDLIKNLRSIKRKL